MPTGDAGRRLGKSPRTIRRWILDGRLAGERIGKVWAASESAVAALEQGSCQDGANRMRQPLTAEVG